MSCRCTSTMKCLTPPSPVTPKRWEGSLNENHLENWSGRKMSRDCQLRPRCQWVDFGVPKIHHRTGTNCALLQKMPSHGQTQMSDDAIMERDSYFAEASRVKETLAEIIPALEIASKCKAD